MLRFFRKIRQKLLSESRLSKPVSPIGRYLIYAFGEIFLVVIGILIALQVNNWNEWKKERLKEQDVLIELVENLEINLKTIIIDIENLQLLDKSSEIVLSYIYNKRPYVDSLALHFHLARIPKQELFLSQIGYEGYKDIGLQILPNKALKNQVLTLFETTYQSFFSNYNMVNGFNPDFDNHIVQNFIYSGKRLVPIAYPEILTDHYYLSWIRAYKEGRYTLIQSEEALLEDIQEVLELLKKELNS